MKPGIYNHIMRAQMSRRKMLKGATATGAVAAAGGVFTGTSVRPAYAGARMCR